MLAFAEKVVLHAYQVTQEDIDNLRRHSFSDADILDIILVTAWSGFIGMVVDAVGFPLSLESLRKKEETLGEDLYRTLQVGRVYEQAD